MNPRRVLAVTGKEGREILRDPITLAVTLLMPLVMLFLFGYAITLDVDDIALGVLDADDTPASRALVSRFLDSGQFRATGWYRSEHELGADLQAGRARLALVIPPDFGERLARGEGPAVQLVVDGTYAATSVLVASYAQAVVSGFPGRARAQGLETRVWYNPALRSSHSVVPGLYAVILLAFPPLLTALAVVREKETGTIEQIYASPLSSAEFIVGKLIPYGLIAFLQLLTVVAAGLLWFQVPFRGGPIFLLGAGLVYVFCTVGIGLLVSTVTRSQLVAMLTALIITLMPSFLFSGLLFPIFTMPYALQLYTAVFPGRYFVDIARGVALKGLDPQALGLNLIVLAGYTLAVFLLAAWRLKKKVA